MRNDVVGVTLSLLPPNFKPFAFRYLRNISLHTLPPSSIFHQSSTASVADSSMEAPSLTLVVLRGPLQGKIFEFRPGCFVKIGRVLRGNTFAIKDEGISSKHLLIESESGKWTVQDLGSSNGTNINSDKLPPHQPLDLHDGDQIKLGEVTSIQVQFRIGNRNPSPELRRGKRRRVSSADVSESSAKVMVEKNESEPSVEVEGVVNHPKRVKRTKAGVSEQNVDPHQPVVRRIATRSKRNELEISTSDCVELGFQAKKTRPLTRKGKKNLAEEEVQEENANEVVVEEEMNRKLDSEKAPTTTTTTGEPDSSQCKGEASGEKAGEKLDVDLEKMTAKNWFDYMEMQFRAQTVKATEEVIEELRKRAVRVREYMIEQKCLMSTPVLEHFENYRDRCNIQNLYKAGLPLPRFVVFESRTENDTRYLRYIHEQGEINDAISCDGDNATNPKAKFELEHPRSIPLVADKPVVHIRSCYNNKYLRMEQHRWIVAAADELDEDQCLWSCTLFEPVFSLQDPNRVRLLHVQSRLYLHCDGVNEHVLTVDDSEVVNDEKDGLLFEIINWESLVMLPRHVAFKGDNGLFIAVRKIEGCSDPCLQFGVMNERDDRSVRNWIVPRQDGFCVRIWNDSNGSFWKRDDCNWICPLGKADRDDGSLDAVFKVIKIKDNTIALLNLGNNHFCKRYTVGKATSCLRAMDETVTEFGHLEVTELVTFRSIYNIQFRLEHARIIPRDEKDSSTRIMATTVAINNADEPTTKVLKLTFDDTRSSTWKSSSLFRQAGSPKVRIESEVVHIRDSEIEVSASELGTSYVWDETTMKGSSVTRVHKVVVAPMTKVTVRLLATIGTCEVPFSYTQHDVLCNGEEETDVQDDGLYIGMNAYNFVYETLEERLESS
ncbi:FHA domain-containing protein At4g14490 [Linum perenne]